MVAADLLFVTVFFMIGWHLGLLGPLVGYTALTISLWILVGARTPISYVDRQIEVALIALLVLQTRRTR